MENNNIVKYEIIDDLPDKQKAKNQLATIKAFQDTVRTELKAGQDYGKTFDYAKKPSLYKSGAEKIIMILGLKSFFSIEEKIENHGMGYFFYSIKCQLVKNGEVITEGLGSCNSKESKFILKEKKNKKTGKVYYTPTEEDQKTYSFTMANTVLKMAKKRAMVDAVLIFACLSNIFTQDIEDISNEDDNDDEPSNNTPKQTNITNTNINSQNDDYVYIITDKHNSMKNKDSWKSEFGRDIFFDRNESGYWKLKASRKDEFKEKYKDICYIEEKQFDEWSNDELLRHFYKLVRICDKLSVEFKEKLKADKSYMEKFFKHMFEKPEPIDMERNVLLETIQDLKDGKPSMTKHIIEWYEKNK